MIKEKAKSMWGWDKDLTAHKGIQCQFVDEYVIQVLLSGEQFRNDIQIGTHGSGPIKHVLGHM